MPRVFGQLFSDGRDGILVTKPSQPFFGTERDETHFDVVDGSIDIELSPTPRGLYYNVGFKKHGDFRDTIYTLKWRIPSGVHELDISPKPAELSPQSKYLSSFETSFEVIARRMATEQAEQMQAKESLESELRRKTTESEELKEKIASLEKINSTALALRDEQIHAMHQTYVSEPTTIYVSVPVPPEPLKERISFLELELKRLIELNDTYYSAVLELNQVKLERAQTIRLPQTVEDIPDTTRQRLIQKLMAK